MKCPNCKTDNPAEERFCWRCHLPLEESRGKWAGHAAIVKGRQRTLRLLLFVLVAAAVGFAVIQVTYRRSPGAVAEAFTKARQRADFRTMYLLLSKKSQKDLGRQGVRDIWPAEPNVEYKFSVIDWRRHGEEALVRVAVDKEIMDAEGGEGTSSGPQTEMLRLVKEDGRWRVEFGDSDR